MEDRKTKFKAWYKRFLMQTERLGIDDKTAESEAENAYSLIPEDAECDISDSKYCKLCKDDSDVTYTDKLLELIRSAVLTEPEHPESPHTEQVA